MSHSLHKTTRSFLLPITIISVSFLLLAVWMLPALMTNAAVLIPLNLKTAVTCASGVPKVVLTWANPNGANDFTVFRNPTPKGALSWVLFATTIPTTYTDATVKVGSTNSYQIRAIDPQGGTRYSDIVTVQNISCPLPTTPTRITFNPKISVACTSAAPSVLLSWTNPNGAQSFTIFRNPDSSGTLAWGAMGEAPATTYSDNTSKIGRAYQYQIRAIAPDTTSRYSDILTTPTITCPATVASTPSPVPPPPPPPQPSQPPPPPPPPTTPATTPTIPASTPPVVQPKVLKWGAYPGWQTTEITYFESQVVKNPNHIAAFAHWASGATDFPTYLTPYAKAKGRTLIIFWEASDHKIPQTTQPLVSYDSILGGTWDHYIRSFAEQARTYGGPIILVPFSEANGNWSPWSGTTNGNTPEKAVLGYRHVRTIFGNVPNVKFGWVVNSNSVPDTAGNAIEKYYPGSAYVDYVGVDGFNFGNPWLTFDQIFKKPLTLLASYGKPMYVFSFASAAGASKAAWITNALTVELQKYPLVEGWSWFNQSKEQNWLIWSDSASLQAFKNALP